MIGTNFSARALATLGPTPWENDMDAPEAAQSGGNPWDNDPDAPESEQLSPRLSAQPGVIRGAPKQPTVVEDRNYQLAVQSGARADAASQRAEANQQRQIGLQEQTAGREAAQATSTAQNRTFDNVSGLRKEFMGLPQTKDYNVVLPLIASAERAATNPNSTGADDLSLIYAFSKAMDPGSVVRESEMAMASSTGSWAQNLEAAAERLKSGERLPPEIRHNLVESMRRRGIEIARGYNQQRGFYKDLAGRSGVNPLDVVGTHPGGPYQQAEADFTGHPIGNLDGSIGARPAGSPPAGATPAPPQDRGDLTFNDQMPDKAASSFRLTPEQDSAFRALIQHGGTDEQVAALMNEFHPGANIRNIDELRKFATDPKTKGLPFGETDYSRIDAIKPVDPGDGAIGAAARGMANAGSLGFMDEMGAAADALQGGKFSEALDRRRGMEVFDEQQHPWARTAGQVVGGVALPLGGAKTLPEIARAGAVLGGAYGAGSADGGIGDRVLGAVGGAASGYAGGLAGGAIGKTVAGIGSKAFRRAGDAALPIVEAAERQKVPITVPDVMPSARATFGALETIPGAGGAVRKALDAGDTAMGQRLGEIGGPGAAVERTALGDTFRDAGTGYSKRSRAKVSSAFDIADRSAAGQQVKPDEAVKVLDAHIADLERTPESSAELLNVLRSTRADLVDAAGAAKPIDADALRTMKSRVGKQTGGESLRHTDIERRMGDVYSAAKTDITSQVTPQTGRAYHRAEAMHRRRMENMKVVEGFIGKDGQLDSEKIVSRIENAAAPRAGAAGKLETMLDLSKPEAREELAATMVEHMGRKGGDAGADFSPARFLSDLDKLSPRAREAVWGKHGSKNLEDLATLARARVGVRAERNNSRSAVGTNFMKALGTIVGGVGGGGAATYAAGMGTGVGAGGAAAVGGAAYVTAKILGSSRAVSALAWASRVRSPAAQRMAVRRIGAIAAKEPALSADLLPIKEALEASIDAKGDD